MDITEINVAYEETCSLPGYANVRPGVRLVAKLDKGDDADDARRTLMARARGMVQDEIDRALESCGRSPRYAPGPLYQVAVINREQLVLLSPAGHIDLTDNSIALKGEPLRLEPARAVAERIARERGYKLVDES